MRGRVFLVVAVVAFGIGWMLNMLWPPELINVVWRASQTGEPAPTNMPILLMTPPGGVDTVDAKGVVNGRETGLIVARCDEAMGPAVQRIGSSVARGELSLSDPSDPAAQELWRANFGGSELSSCFGGSLRSAFTRQPDGEVLLRVVTTSAGVRESRYRLVGPDTFEPTQYSGGNLQSVAGSDMVRLALLSLGAVTAGIIGSKLAEARQGRCTRDAGSRSSAVSLQVP
jgi:hypothetical protein